MRFRLFEDWTNLLCFWRLRTFLEIAPRMAHEERYDVCHLEWIEAHRPAFSNFNWLFCKGWLLAFQLFASVFVFLAQYDQTLISLPAFILDYLSFNLRFLCLFLAFKTQFKSPQFKQDGSQPATIWWRFWLEYCMLDSASLVTDYVGRGSGDHNSRLPQILYWKQTAALFISCFLLSPILSLFF